MLVNDYMSSCPVTIRDDAEYLEAFEIMNDKNLHHLPVVNSKADVIGILALRNLQLATRTYRESPVEIAAIMHTPVMTIRSGSELAIAARLMVEHRIGCLPVMDDDNHMIGMLTESDLFRALIVLLNGKS